MLKEHGPFLYTGLVLILPGLYLLWYAHGHADFYREKRWENWQGRAALVGLIIRVVFSWWGYQGVRLCFQLFALACIGVGVWALCLM